MIFKTWWDTKGLVIKKSIVPATAVGVDLIQKVLLVVKTVFHGNVLVSNQKKRKGGFKPPFFLIYGKFLEYFK